MCTFLNVVFVIFTQYPNICIGICRWKANGTFPQKMLQTCFSVCENKLTIKVSGANVAQLQVDFCQQTQTQVEIIFYRY